jgi:hypothetical protein
VPAQAQVPLKVAELWRRHAAHYAALLAGLDQQYRAGSTASQAAEAVAGFDTEWGQLHVAQHRVATHHAVDPDGQLAFVFLATA